MNWSRLIFEHSDGSKFELVCKISMANRKCNLADETWDSAVESGCLDDSHWWGTVDSSFRTESSCQSCVKWTAWFLS